MKKQALDNDAASYWEQYYAESGYGKLWTRTIPKKVASALEKKIAKTNSKPTIQPLSSVVTDKGVSLEGIAVYADLKKAFVADFDHKGELVGFDVVDIA